MGFLANILSKLKFTTSKTIDIFDWRLALCQYTLQILFLLYFLFDLIVNNGHLYNETPVGRVASSYVSRGKLTDFQDEQPKFCDVDRSPSFTWDGCKDDPFWCDDRVRCISPQFNQMYSKEDSSIWLFTYNKDAVYQSLPSCEGQSSSSNSCPEGAHFIKEAGQCQCLTVNNYWMKGAEGLTLNVVPTYSHTTTIAQHTKQDYVTEVYNATGGLTKTFEPGEVLSFTVEEILQLVGRDLDETNPFAEDAFKSIAGSAYKDDEQVYRMTGLEVELEFEFNGVVTQEPAEDREEGVRRDDISLVVRARDRRVSYASKGSDVVYEQYPVYNCTETDECRIESQVFVDRFNRGIKVSFSFTGKIYTFSIFALVNSLTNFLVLFGLAGTVVSIAAMSLMGHSSKIFEGVRAQDVSVDRTHAKIGVQSIVAALSFDMMAQHGNGIDENTLVDVLRKHGVAEEDARAIAANIISQADDDDDGKLQYREWADIVTEDMVSMDEIVAFMHKQAGKEEAKAAKAGVAGSGQNKGKKYEEAKVAPADAEVAPEQDAAVTDADAA